MLFPDGTFTFERSNVQNSVQIVKATSQLCPTLKELVQCLCRHLIQTLEWNCCEETTSSHSDSTTVCPHSNFKSFELSDGLYSTESDLKGAGLYSSKTLNPDQVDTLLHEPPLLSWMISSTWFTTCQHCSRPLPTDLIRLPYVCRRCHSRSYCSEQCARSAWTLSHRFECDTFANVALPLGRLEFDVKAALIHSNQASAELDQFVQKSTFFASLGVKERLCFAFTAMLESRLVASFGPLQMDSVKLSVWLLRFKIIDNINSFQLESHGRNVGHVIYLCTSLINHSCRPNCAIDFDGTCARIRPQQRIKVGDELTISYLPSHLLHDRLAARRLLRTIFYFDCQCGFCGTA
jgi:hypothetical protein